MLETNTTPKNGDVKNPREKETRRPPKNNNRLLRDLIRILIIRELLSGRPGFIPGHMPRPVMEQGMGDMFAPPPIMRPRKSYGVLKNK